MSYLAGKLKHRIHIMQGLDEPFENGSFKRTYKKLLTLWSGKKQISNYIMAIRSVNADKIDIDTDEFLVRYDSVISKFYRTFDKGFELGIDSLKSDGLGKCFDSGYDNGYDSMADMYPIKADYFIFLQQGNMNNYRGRLYKINRIVRDDNLKEFVIIKCKELEEVGLGAKE